MLCALSIWCLLRSVQSVLFFLIFIFRVFSGNGTICLCQSTFILHILSKTNVFCIFHFVVNSHFSVSRLPGQASWSCKGQIWLCSHYEASNIFLLLLFEPMNARSLLKSQCYYNTPAATCFGSYWPMIREHTIAQDGCLTFSAHSRTSENPSMCNT